MKNGKILVWRIIPPMQSGFRIIIFAVKEVAH